MPQINIEIRHELPQNEVLTRIKKLLPQLKQQHADRFSNLKENWAGYTCKFSFTAKGFNVSGALAVNRTSIEVEGELPLPARLFKGKIEQIIREKAEELLR